MTSQQANEQIAAYLKSIEGKNIPQELVTASITAILSLVK